MIKRLFTLITIFLLLGTAAHAKEEYNVTLQKGDSIPHIVALTNYTISFDLKALGTNYRATVSIENTSTYALLMFKSTLSENILKKNKPKIQFDKSFPGPKNNRYVSGCDYLSHKFDLVMPGDRLDLFSFNISDTAPFSFNLPIYPAYYDLKKLQKKGVNGIDYKILSENMISFNVDLRGWDENDPEYASIRKRVNDYVYKVDKLTFCKNPKHIPSLAEQKRPYKVEKDSLIKDINAILEEHGEWLTIDKPYKKYKELLDRLNAINLDDHAIDCGNHGKNPDDDSGRKPTCPNCKLSPQQVYHQLDDIYQQLRNGKISKSVAKQKADALYKCYQSHRNRKRDASYTGKISKFYNRILGF